MILPAYILGYFVTFFSPLAEKVLHNSTAFLCHHTPDNFDIWMEMVGCTWDNGILYSVFGVIFISN